MGTGLRRPALRRALLCALVAPALASAEPIRFARYPAISNDGTIAFSYHGDIWLANSDGSNSRRLTAHIARDINPRFSPDGKWVAFSSNRMGNNDVFVVPATGGEPRHARSPIGARRHRARGQSAGRGRSAIVHARCRA